MNRLLGDQIQFEPLESLVRFRHSLLKYSLLVAVFSALCVAVMYDLGLHNTGYFHSRVNYVYSISSLALFIWIIRSPERYKQVALLLVSISMVVFTSALIFVVEDQFRIVWFYIVVFVAYMTLGNRAGIITSILSIIIILISDGVFELALTRSTLQGAIIGLVISSALASIHVLIVSDFEKKLISKNRELEVLATIDGLTGVVNKRMFSEMAEKYIETASRKNNPLSFLYLDLDHFKKINDEYGHHVGDTILIKFADVVRECLRKSDLLGRVGGEEFAVILFDADLNAAKLVAEKIRAAVEISGYQYENQRVQITTSIGMTKMASVTDTLESMQQRADQALYKAKASGRNRIEVL
ncbi:MAG: GGDEF domain-containing protein [Gammaproteobacteria bacterium]|nr:GGDEF domain-containing protein [Gammaproteobacteria bacterium]